MRVSENVYVNTGVESWQIGSTERQQSANAQERQAGGGVIFVGNLNQDLIGDRIAQRKESAREQAMKVVRDAWEGDRTIEDDMKARRSRIDELKSEMRNAENQRKNIEDKQVQLQKQYGIAPDSQEQKDLELLRRKHGLTPGGGAADMTPEEMEYVSKLEANGLTEYQQRQLDYDREKQYYQEQYEACWNDIKLEIATINATKLERLKHSPMVSAQRQADEIEKAAQEEIVNMLVEEGKEHIEQEKEERQEKAEALEEQKEEREAFIEAQQERKKETEELLEEMPVEEMLALSQIKSDVQKEVQNIVDKMKLVAEDIKGNVVDENI